MFMSWLHIEVSVPVCGPQEDCITDAHNAWLITTPRYNKGLRQEAFAPAVRLLSQVHELLMRLDLKEALLVEAL
jgi:hypothetical protein